MNKRILSKITTAVALVAAMSTTALAYDVSTVSPSAPFGSIPVDPTANSLAEVNAQLATLTSAEVSDLIDRCEVINSHGSSYADAVVIFCHRVLVAEGELTTNDTGVATANDADDNYDDNDADPVDDNDAL